ncbi:MAG: bifunctional DNA-formamidopyrimidine glycosylase/DNA-(apurinic or apyrimidinic site) lyase [Candidatus Thorarchaeota archaeon]
MPEGPEVECTRLSLQAIFNKKIKKMHFTDLSQKYRKYYRKQKELDNFEEKKIKTIERKGKFLIWIFNFEKVILNHLGMSGKWIFVNENEENPTHAKVIIKFLEFKQKLIFDDVRNFGQFRVLESYESILKYEPIRKMGIDGLALPFPIDNFLTELKKSNYINKEIGDILINQKFVAGIGNIYRSEALFHAKINPRKLVKNLSSHERKKLGYAISDTLHRALECQGSSFNIQPFQTPFREEGSAQQWHKVYGKQNQPCQICETEIVAIKNKGRRIFFCPKCQK